MKYFAFIGVFFVSVAVPASDTVDQFALAQRAYAVGNFTDARTSGREVGTADSFALACQAGLVIGGFQEKGAAAVHALHGALADCRKAIDLDPAHFTAGLSHAIATGFEGLRLRKTAYARASKKDIEALIKRYPSNAFAVGALAGWHAAVAREGLFARLALGADRAKARRLYVQAVQLPGADLPLYFDYIRFLADGKSDDKAEALRLLADIFANPPAGGLAGILLDKCRQLQAALLSGDKKALKQALAAAMPFGDIDVWGAVRKTNVDGFPLREGQGLP